MKKSLILSAMAVTLAAFTASAETKTVEVNGYNGKAAMNWTERVAKWTSNSDITPSIVISSPNNMTASGTVTINASSTGADFELTITAEEGWYVTNIAGSMNSMSGCTLTIDGKEVSHTSGASVTFSEDVAAGQNPLAVGVALPQYGNATLTNLTLTLSNDPIQTVDPNVKVFDVLYTTGSLYREGALMTSGYANVWKSELTEPQLTLTVTNSDNNTGMNNINANITEGGLQIHSCHNVSKSGANVTFTTDEGWYVSAISFTGVCESGKTNTVTIGEAVFALTTSGENVAANFTHEEVATILLGGDFAPITFNDFTVTVSKVPETPVDPDEKYYETLSHALWTADVSSQTEDGSLTQYGPQVGFDDNISTFWGNSWANAGGFENSQVYHVDLGETVTFDGFDYTSRQAGNSLDILGQYEIYVTDEALTREQSATSEYLYIYGFEGQTPVAEGTMADSRETQRVIFDAPVTGRHFYIRALSATNGKGGSSNVFTVAELSLLREVINPDFVYWTEPVVGVQFNTEGKWSIKSFCCEEATGEDSGANGKIEYLIDDKAATYYHSQWAGSEYKGHHGFIIDFGETVTAEGFAWIPRQKVNSNNGRWTKYRVWFYDNEEDLPTLEAHQGYEDFITGTPDAEGTLTAVAGDPVETSIFPEPLSGRYMLVIPDGNGNWSCAAEVGIAAVTGEETKSELRSEFVKPYVARVENMRNALPGINEVLDGVLSSIEEASNEEVY
ncbi:MAG: discoidin domain-containing protein, partial [Muribaculaceae bacterium]|nr:discoidin domain-containing protein [Muribaculaceae bacterium]